MHQCNATVTVVRTSEAENWEAGKDLAEKANAAKKNGSPVAILIPRKGFSMFAEKLPGWADPKADEAFIAAILTYADNDVPIKIMDSYINDIKFANEAAFTMLSLINNKPLNWARPSLEVFKNNKSTIPRSKL